MFALKLCAVGALSVLMSCTALAGVIPVRDLSIRASDTGADAVVPSAASGTVIVKFANARHNDVSDAGSGKLEARILAEIEKFLQKQGGQDGA